MKGIIRDFLKAHITMLLQYAAVVALCVIGFLLTGIFTKDNTRLAGIVVTAFLCAILVWAFVDVLIVAPGKFRAKLNSLSENERQAVVEGYAGASKIGKRFFFKNGWFMVYSYRRIQLMKYGELSSAEPKGNNIFLTLTDGSTVLMPVEMKENDAMLLAALKQYNPDIKILINGKPVNAQCAKGETDGKDDP